MVLVFALALVAGCTDGGNGDDSAPSTTLAPDVDPTVTTGVPAPEPPAPTTTELRDDRGRPAASVFTEGIRSPYAIVELDAAALAAVSRQFTGDERLAAEVIGVDARVLRLRGTDIGAVVALAVDPVSALDENWRQDFEDAVTSGAIRPAVPVRIGTEPAIRFPVAGEGDTALTTILWRWDNVFVLFSGADGELLDDAAESLLDRVVGPFPTTTTLPPTTTTDPTASTTTDPAAADGDSDSGSTDAPATSDEASGVGGATLVDVGA